MDGTPTFSACARLKLVKAELKNFKDEFANIQNRMAVAHPELYNSAFQNRNAMDVDGVEIGQRWGVMKNSTC